MTTQSDITPPTDTPSPLERARRQASARRQRVNRSNERIGRYRIINPIGHGGMGMVYLAEQEEPLRLKVALKVINPWIDSRIIAARFESEREALARMEHPHIARVLDAGTTPDKKPYITMEYVAGPSITAYCDGKTLAVQERLELFLKVCDAVQHAHYKGFIHRDLKPSNILVASIDGVPTPKVIDFGIAAALEGAPDDRTRMTAAGQIVGTAEYMSPEQADPASVDRDTRSDIYALGVVLYELLTGRLPYGDDQLVHLRQAFERGDYSGVHGVLISRIPQLPSNLVADLAGQDATRVARERTTTAHNLSRSLRGDLDCIALTALAHEADRRYGSPAELAADLRRYMAGDAIVARPATWGYRLSRVVRKHRSAVAAGVAVLLSLVVTTAVSTTAYFSVQERERLVRSALDEFVEVFEQASPNHGSTEVAAYEVLSNAVVRLRTVLADEPLLLAEVFEGAGTSFKHLSRYDEAVAVLQTVYDVYRDELGIAHPRTIVARYLLANAQHAATQAGPGLEIGTAYEEVIADYAAVVSDHDPQYADMLVTLGYYRKHRGEFDTAMGLFLSALEILEEDGTDPVRLDRARYGLARLYVHQAIGKKEAARALYETILADRLERLAVTHPHVLEVQLDLANLSPLERRRELIDKTLVQTATLPPPHMLRAAAFESRSALFRDLRDYPRAVEDWTQTLEIRKQIGGETVQSAALHHAIGELAWQYDDALARQHFDDAIRIAGDTLADGRSRDEAPLIIRSLNARATALNELQRYGEAEPLLIESIALCDALRGADNPWCCTARYEMFKILEGQQRLDELEALFATLEPLLLAQGEGSVYHTIACGARNRVTALRDELATD